MYFCLKIIARLKYTELGQLCVEFEVDIEKLKKYTCPGTDQITAEFESSRIWDNVFRNTYSD
jgi:hypothetical protein